MLVARSITANEIVRMNNNNESDYENEGNFRSKMVLSFEMCFVERKDACRSDCRLDSTRLTPRETLPASYDTTNIKPREYLYPSLAGKTLQVGGWKNMSSSKRPSSDGR